MSVPSRGTAVARPGGSPRRAPRAEDRRVVRTRQLLRQAIMALTVERGYEGVTVQDVLDRANLGRSTFYAHFRNKDDLLLSGFEEFLTLLESLGSTEMGLAAFSLHMFRHVAAVRPLLAALFGHRGSPVLRERIQATLERALRRRIELLAAPERALASATIDMVAHFYTSALVAQITFMLDRGRAHTPEQMDAFFQSLVMPGVLGTLRAAPAPAGGP
jgi:AcrR family transcriptional regulator